MADIRFMIPIPVYGSGDTPVSNEADKVCLNRLHWGFLFGPDKRPQATELGFFICEGKEGLLKTLYSAILVRWQKNGPARSSPAQKSDGSLEELYHLKPWLILTANV